MNWRKGVKWKKYYAKQNKPHVFKDYFSAILIKTLVNLWFLPIVINGFWFYIDALIFSPIFNKTVRFNHLFG